MKNIAVFFFILTMFFILGPNLIQANAASDLYNLSFEEDNNGNGISDHWEISWPIGNAAGYYSKREPYEPAHGNYHHRLFSGTGDASSMIYVMSDPISVQGSKIYTAKAYMRYTLPTGRAEFSLIQLDAQRNNIGEHHATYSNGGWQWQDQTQTFSTQSNAVYIIFRFGVGGEEAAYLDMDNIRLEQLDWNGEFEHDRNQNNLPDFWESTWRNGVSKGASAGLYPDEIKRGTYNYRLFSGTGDAASMQYVHSDVIPIHGGFSYLVGAQMRYTLQDGGEAQMSLIELDLNYNIVNEIHTVHKYGYWQWYDQTIIYIPHSNAAYFYIRFGVGGEEGSYLDIDSVSVSPYQFSPIYQYIFDNKDRLMYVLTRAQKVIRYVYDNNGNLVNKIEVH